MIDFHAHALREFPRECCGLVIAKGKSRKMVYVPCRNLAATSMEHVVMSPEDYADAEDQGEVVALCHSHPNHSCEPSDADRAMCEASGLRWYIVSLDANGIIDQCSIEPSGYETPLLKRAYVTGVHDCYGLVRDWYMRERAVTLPDFPRRDDWWENGLNLLLDNYRAAGFVALPEGSEWEPGDVPLMQIRSPVPNHCGVYIGDDLLLHHPIQRVSRRDVYGGYWHEVTTHHLRFAP